MQANHNKNSYINLVQEQHGSRKKSETCVSLFLNLVLHFAERYRGGDGEVVEGHIVEENRG